MPAQVAMLNSFTQKLWKTLLMMCAVEMLGDYVWNMCDMHGQSVQDTLYYTHMYFLPNAQDRLTLV